MNELEVNCVQRVRPDADHHEITHLGHLGFGCMVPVELAVVQVMSRVNRFYTVDPRTQTRIFIEVRREAGHCPYLQAQFHGEWTQHLLALPECRPSFRIIRAGVTSETRYPKRFRSRT